jgi:hypothetical protein
MAMTDTTISISRIQAIIYLIRYTFFFLKKKLARYYMRTIMKESALIAIS